MPPPIIITTPWLVPSISTTASNWPGYSLLEQYQLATALGAYQHILLQQQTQTGGGWLTTSITSPTTAAWPAYQYQQLFPQAFDVPMPAARQRALHVGRPPAVIHAGRRAVRRSIDLYLRMRPIEELRRFIAGRQIIVQGARFRYALRKTTKIMEHTISPTGGHIPYRLHMLDPDLAEPHPLASGCVYLDRTPVLDQVLAFIMHATDPDGEREIIRRTNWSPALPNRILHLLAEPPMNTIEEALLNAA